MARDRIGAVYRPLTVSNTHHAGALPSEAIWGASALSGQDGILAESQSRKVTEAAELYIHSSAAEQQQCDLLLQLWADPVLLEHDSGRAMTMFRLVRAAGDQSTVIRTAFANQCKTLKSNRTAVADSQAFRAESRRTMPPERLAELIGGIDAAAVLDAREGPVRLRASYAGIVAAMQSIVFTEVFITFFSRYHAQLSRDPHFAAWASSVQKLTAQIQQDDKLRELRAAFRAELDQDSVAVAQQIHRLLYRGEVASILADAAPSVPARLDSAEARERNILLDDWPKPMPTKNLHRKGQVMPESVVSFQQLARGTFDNARSNLSKYLLEQLENLDKKPNGGEMHSNLAAITGDEEFGALTGIRWAVQARATEPRISPAERTQWYDLLIQLELRALTVLRERHAQRLTASDCRAALRELSQFLQLVAPQQGTVLPGWYREILAVYAELRSQIIRLGALDAATQELFKNLESLPPFARQTT